MAIFIKNSGSASLLELLVRASSLPDDEAIKAWNEWKSRIDLDGHLDPDTFRLLPQLYRNLQNQGVTDPLMMKLKGIFRKTWYKNQILFRNASAFLHSLHNAGIETLILYDAALTVLYNWDYGLRNMIGFSVLVHPQQAITAIKHLRWLNWRPLSRLPDTLTETHIFAGHVYRFQNAIGQMIYLHWYALPAYYQVNADNDFWYGAVAAEMHDVPTYILNPTDQLLQVCVQGAPLHIAPLFLRAADAKMVLNKAQSEIDWDRLITQAQKRRLLLPLTDTLTYLQDKLDTPLPPVVLPHIQVLPTSKYEQIEYKFKTSRLTLLNRFFELWFNYSRRTNERSLFRNIVGFPRYLQQFWFLEHLWQVPLQAISAARARLRQSAQ